MTFLNIKNPKYYSEPKKTQESTQLSKQMITLENKNGFNPKKIIPYRPTGIF